MGGLSLSEELRSRQRGWIGVGRRWAELEGGIRGNWDWHIKLRKKIYFLKKYIKINVK